MDVLWRIKGLAARQRILFTEKARLELEWSALCEEEVLESLIHARTVRRKRSTSAYRQGHQEMVCIIAAPSRSGTVIYTKGLVRKLEDGGEIYVLISAKRSTTR